MLTALVIAVSFLAGAGVVFCLAMWELSGVGTLP